MKTSTASFRLPDPAPSRFSRWPAFVSIAAIIVTSLIALNPTINERWSRISYPIVAHIDQTLLNYGFVIGPVPESNAVSTQPMIAVVFGCISADEDEAKVEEFPPRTIEPEIPSTPVVRPATFQVRRPRETSEAQELLN